VIRHHRPALCLVDLRGRLSNPAVEAVVAEVGQLAAGTKADTSNQPPPSTSAPAPPRRWRLVDRLGEQIILDLLHDSRRGTAQRKLAEHYGISLSSVKRLTRRSKG
jgi:hypothetical protein